MTSVGHIILTPAQTGFHGDRTGDQHNDQALFSLAPRIRLK